MNDYYVYGYSDPDSPDPYFYIGKGHGKRAFLHLKLCRKKAIGRFYRKLKGMLEKGIQPEITFLSEDLSEETALKLEITFIHLYGRLDNNTGCLCNHTDGGEGVSGLRITETEKKRKADIMIGNQYAKGSTGPLGEIRSIDTRIKVSQANQRRTKQLRNKIKKQHRRNFGIPCAKIDIITGKILQVFQSMGEVKEYGYCNVGVSGVLRGKLRTHAGYYWRYLTQEEIQKLIPNQEGSV